MEKILKIDGKDVSFKSTGGSALRYRMQFGRDFLADILKLFQAFDEKKMKIKNLDYLDMEVFYNLIWTFAKTADSSIPEPLTWLDSFDTFPLAEIIPELIDMISSNLQSIVKSKN